MIKRLRSTFFLASALTFFSFISLNQTQACTGHDVIINKITITSISSSEYAYTYEIKNIGTAAIALNQIVLQNYIFPDDTYNEGFDVAGGGAHIVLSSNTGSIAAGGTYTGTFAIYPGSGHPVSSYPYFSTEVYLDSETECDLNNNKYRGLIEIGTTTATQAAQLASATVNWNTETKSFSVKDWSGNTTSSLRYTVFNMSGTLLLSGNTSEGQATPLASLQNGMYILYLTDGEKVYSKKIIY